MNQREIKFKLWSKRDGWCGGFCVHQTGLISTCINAEIVEPQHMAVADAHWQDLSEQNDLILLQYTGLKDKNGKEIYEGDVIRVKSLYETDEPVDCNAKVLFRDGSFRTDFHDSLLNMAGKNGEIEAIGNVYENPELINQ